MPDPRDTHYYTVSQVWDRFMVLEEDDGTPLRIETDRPGFAVSPGMIIGYDASAFRWFHGSQAEEGWAERRREAMERSLPIMREAQRLAQEQSVKFVPIPHEEFAARLNVDNARGMAAFYDAANDAVVWNLGFIPARRSTSSGFPLGHISTTGPEHAGEHELSHKSHLDTVGPERYNDPDLDQPPENRQQVEREVSDYAGTNRAEFVAEVKVGLDHGQKYSSAVMTQYQQYMQAEMPWNVFGGSRPQPATKPQVEPRGQIQSAQVRQAQAREMKEQGLRTRGLEQRLDQLNRTTEWLEETANDSLRSQQRSAQNTTGNP